MTRLPPSTMRRFRPTFMNTAFITKNLPHVDRLVESAVDLVTLIIKGWPLVGNQGMNPHCNHIKLHSETFADPKGPASFSLEFASDLFGEYFDLKEILVHFGLGRNFRISR